MGNYMMGDKCPYYLTHETTNSRGTELEIPYCSHPKHSPLGYRMVERGVNGKQLECGGSMRKCPIAVFWHDTEKKKPADD